MKQTLCGFHSRVVATTLLSLLPCLFVSAQEFFKPGSAEDAGLTRLLPDKVLFDTGEDNLDNWEPFASVIGNQVFVIEANSAAEDEPSAQRYRVAFQPVGGGAVVEGEGFYGDDGTPYKDQINASRQNGNPGRVAADRRPGATHYIVGGEASPHVYDAFQSGNRWNLGFDRLEDGRYGAVQIFSLDTDTLASTPTSLALDAVNGRLTSGGAAGNQIGRFGGDVTVLDNGNFVVVVDDRSQVLEAGNLSTAVILAADGSVVKESWVVDPRDIWSNVTSYQGGFAVRVHEIIYFHDNDGNVTGSIDILDEALPEGVAFDTGRGDGTRLASHINSPYVFLGGQMPLLDEFLDPILDDDDQPARVARLAAFDSRDASFLAVINVNELTEINGGSDAVDFFAGMDRVNLAADALDRVAVTYEARPFGYEALQVATRVLKFDGASKSFSYLTPSFWAFLNVDEFEIRTFRPTVAMTTKEILIAAKGEISTDNTPLEGPNTPMLTTFYTVLNHPDPQEDPTAPVGGVELSLNISRSGDSLVVDWQGAALETAETITGPWTSIDGAAKPYPANPTGQAAYYRVR